MNTPTLNRQCLYGTRAACVVTFHKIDEDNTIEWTVETYQQTERVCSAYCRHDGLHEDTCIMVLCHATLYEPSIYQTRQ